MQWHYIENGQQAGPVDDATFRELIGQGRISAQTLVWRPDLTTWQPYGDVAAEAADGQPMVMAAEMGSAATGMVQCAECGRTGAAEEMIQYGGRHVCQACKPIFFQKIREGVSVDREFRYAGFWIRVGAKIVDGIVLAIVYVPLLFALGFNFETLAQRRESSGFGMLMLVPVLINMVYSIFMNGKYGQTLGKMAVGVRIIRSGGDSITYGRAFGRFCAESLIQFIPVVGSIISLIGYLIAAFDKQKRALHDHICDTRVVYKK